MDPTFQTQILTQLSQKLIFNFSNKGKDIRYKIVSRGWSGLKNAWDRPVTDVTYSRAGSSSFPFLGIPIFVFGLPPNLTQILPQNLTPNLTQNLTPNLTPNLTQNFHENYFLYCSR